MSPNKSTGYLLLLLVLCSLSLPGLAYGGRLLEAERSYQSGWKSLNEDNFQDAERYFLSSYRLIPHLDTAYALSFTYLKLRRPQEALEFAHKALSADPPLEDPYVENAGRIIDWAKAEEQRRARTSKSSFEASGKADEGWAEPQLALPPPVLQELSWEECVARLKSEGFWPPPKKEFSRVIRDYCGR